MKKICNLVVKYVTIFVFCGLSYVGLELLYRQRSHYTMFLLAGLCGTLFLSILNNFYTYETDYLFQVLICGILCTTSEWICGRLFNSDYRIWDYRELPFSSPDGQINLFFAIAWCVICAVFIPVLDFIEWKIFHYREEISPYYMILGKKFTPYDEN